MKIQYASDLHLEFSANRDFIKINPLVAVADTLILAGDIGTFRLKSAFKDFLKYLEDNFNTVYWVPGNHEWYDYNLNTYPFSFMEKISSNCYLTNNTSIIHGDVKLIFSTLWSKISEANRFRIVNGLNDFRLIKNNGKQLNVDTYNKMHDDSVAFIKSELKNNTCNKTVVVTHHVPTFMNYPEKYKGDYINEAFAVELYDFIFNNLIDYWIFGHTHHNNLRFEIGKCKLLTNQLGYVIHNEHKLFNHESFIKI